MRQCAILTLSSAVKRKAEEDLPSPAAPKRVKHSDSEEPQDDRLEDKDDEHSDMAISAAAGRDAGGDDGDGDEAEADDEEGGDNKDDEREEGDDAKDGDGDEEDKDEEKDDDKKAKTEDDDEPNSEDQSAPALKRIPFPDKASSRHFLYFPLHLLTKVLTYSQVSSRSEMEK